MINKRILALVWLVLMLYAALQAALVVRGGNSTFFGVFIGTAFNEHVRLGLFLACRWLIMRHLHSWHWWWQIPAYFLMVVLLSIALFGVTIGMLVLLQQGRAVENGIGLAFIVLAEYRREIREREERERELKHLNTQMELAALRSQLNPHFLFNALNAVNALVGVQPEKARIVLETLAELLRYSLESDKRDFVSLREELDFVQKYLSIEQERFGKRLHISIDIDETLGEARVPPILIQPLVENAVKHGISPKAVGGTVSVTVRSDASANAEGKRLWVEVSDDGVGMKTNKLGNHEPSIGIGLANTDARLRKLYGEESKLNVESTENGVTVSFSMPLISQNHLSK
jgi:LytS/YehU family sensor histidine kinase